MRTRVGKYYDITAGVWMFYVQQWLPERPTPRFYQSSLSGYEPPPTPAGWVPWPYEHGKPFYTPDESRALRIAKDVSAGKKADTLELVAEFSDGVKFTPVE